jgi:GTP1/Obg family GTP-binding protein
MSDRDKMLSEFRQGIGGIDPMLDQAESYGRAIRETQGLMRQQGQVMSATLQNNHTLYHTNKKLVAENRDLHASNKSLCQANDALHAQNERQREYIQRLESSGSDKFKPLYEDARKTLLSFLHDALSPDQLRERLKAMDEQRKELEALPEVVTRRELIEMEVVVPTPAERAELEREQ